MPVNESVNNFLSSLFDNPLEERVIEYIVRQVESGRSLFEALEDPYVRNRVPEERRAELLSDPDILDTFEKELRNCCEAPSAGDSESEEA